MASVGCVNPAQCAAYLQLGDHVSEMNTKLNNIFGLLQLFFKAWQQSQQKNTLWKEIWSPQKFDPQSARMDDEGETETIPKHPKRIKTETSDYDGSKDMKPESPKIAVTLLQPEFQEFDQQGGIERCSSGSPYRESDPKATASISVISEHNFDETLGPGFCSGQFDSTQNTCFTSQAGAQSEENLPETCVGAEQDWESVDQWQGSVFNEGGESSGEVVFNPIGSVAFREKRKVPLFKIRQKKMRDYGPCWKQECAGRTRIEWQGPGKQPRFRCRACRGSKMLTEILTQGPPNHPGDPRDLTLYESARQLMAEYPAALVGQIEGLDDAAIDGTGNDT